MDGQRQGWVGESVVVFVLRDKQALKEAGAAKLFSLTTNSKSAKTYAL